MYFKSNDYQAVQENAQNKSLIEERKNAPFNNSPNRLSIELSKQNDLFNSNEDEDISRIKQLSLLTAGARYQLLKVNQQLMNFGMLKPNVTSLIIAQNKIKSSSKDIMYKNVSHDAIKQGKFNPIKLLKQ
jgi:hypothetical protein